MGWVIYEPKIGKWIKSLYHYIASTPYGQIELSSLSYKKWTRIHDIILEIKRDAHRFPLADATVKDAQYAFISDSEDSNLKTYKSIIKYIEWYNEEVKN